MERKIQMTASKLFKYFLGFSFLAGVTSASLKYKEKNANKKLERLFSFYIGTWQLYTAKNSAYGELTITTDGEFYLNKKSLEGTILSLTEKQLVYLDHFGYELYFNRDVASLTMLDSSDNSLYNLIKLGNE